MELLLVLLSKIAQFHLHILGLTLSNIASGFSSVIPKWFNSDTIFRTVFGSTGAWNIWRRVRWRPAPEVINVWLKLLGQQRHLWMLARDNNHLQEEQEDGEAGVSWCCVGRDGGTAELVKKLQEGWS